MKITLIEGSNPRGQSNDPYVDFRNYTSFEDAKWRSWQSIPCALKTEFFPYNGTNFHECYKYDAFIVLFNDDPEYLIPFVKKLKLMGKKVAVGHHEGFADWILKGSQNPTWLYNSKKLVQEADFYWNIMPSKESAYRAFYGKEVKSGYHGAPFGFYDDLIVPEADREGVLISTRTFNQRLQRNTLWSLIEANNYAKENNTFFTFVVEDDYNGQFKFENMRVVKGPLQYTDWLKLIAKHKFIYGQDEAHSLAQVAIDAALVDVTSWGGNGENHYLGATDCKTIHAVKFAANYANHGSIVNHLRKELSLEKIENINLKMFDHMTYG